MSVLEKTEPAGPPAEPYDALAAVYDAWQGRYGDFARVILPRLERALGGFGQVRSFVDFGCGTGTLLLALARRHPHLQLSGVDASAAMLAGARGKAGATRVHWYQGRLGEPLVGPYAGAPFDAAGCFFNTLNHLPDVPALERAFTGIARLLAPGGRLVFDVNTAVGFARWWQGERVYTGRGWRFEMEAAFDPEARRAVARARVTVEGRPPVDSEIHERLFTDDEIGAALARAGLTTVDRTTWAPLDDGVRGACLWAAQRAESIL